MKHKDLNSVIGGNAFLNIISESRHWLFMDIIRNEFLL
jgi:hypothetical protein